MDMNEIAASWVLGLTSNEKLPEICLDFLDEDCPSETLATLASYRANELRSEEIEELFAKSLRELGLEMPDKIAAAERLCISEARAALEGRSTARVAVRKISSEIYPAIRDLKENKNYVGDAFDLEKIYGADDDFAEFEEGVDYPLSDLERVALEALREYLAGHAA